ncbi:MAG: tetratricopeptide repeat protein, partial [Planctomycetota bacterium]
GALFERYQIAKATQQADLVQQRLQLFTSKMRGSVHTSIEIALDYIGAGYPEDAAELLQIFVGDAASDESVYPMVYYYLGCLGHAEYLQKAASAKPDYCFPHRLESLVVLQKALDQNPNDAKGWYYLGNLWYSKQQYDSAIEAWEKSAALKDSFPTVHRNLGLAYYNKRNDLTKSRKAYEKAYSLDCSDARILYELDQLYKKMGKSPQERLMFMELHPEVVKQRDDLYIEFLWLLNQTGAYEKALDLLEHRLFHPWEGGEGKTTGAYVFSLTEIAKKKIAQKKYVTALETLSKTETFPPNLAEGKLHGRLENDLHYYRGLAFEGLGDLEKAKDCFRQATQGLAELGDAMYYNDQPPEQIYYQGLAYEKLAEDAKADECFNRLISYGRAHYDDEIKIDFFAVSLPDFLIFDEDLTVKNKIHCHYLMGLGRLGLKQTEEARQDFETILNVNPAHTGAIVHLGMIAGPRPDNNRTH